MKFKITILYLFGVIFLYNPVFGNGNSTTNHLSAPNGGVKVIDYGTYVVVSNDFVSFRIDKSNATMRNLYYDGKNMLGGNYSGGKLYYVWVLTRFQTPSNCTYTLVTDPNENNGQLTELKFHMTWSGSSEDAPVDVEIYYALKDDSRGVYTAMMMHHPKSYPRLPSGQ